MRVLIASTLIVYSAAVALADGVTRGFDVDLELFPEKAEVKAVLSEAHDEERE